MAKKNILLVIDVQNDFITGALRNEEAIKKLPNIVKLVKEGNWDEIYATMDTHDKDTYLNKTLEGKNLPVEHCLEGTWGWQMPQELQDALFLDNPAWREAFMKDTFGSTYLANMLHSTHQNDNGAKDYEFTIVGFCTDICVVSNALLLRANFPNNTIKTMEMCQIEVV